MRLISGPRLLGAICAAALVPSLAGASSASAQTTVKRVWMQGFAAPETPEGLDKVGVLKIGSPRAKNVLVLEPGTSAGAGYFVPFAKWLTELAPGWQVWSVERRENRLEDQRGLEEFKRGEITPKQFFRYYLGYLTEPSDPEPHMHQVRERTAIRDGARQWGMNVAVQDLHVVIDAAKALGGKVVLGGHSLGGSVVTAYATWDFGGKAGAEGLSGLVYDDGGSSPIAISEAEATTALAKLDKPTETPWLAFGGIAAPDLGLFSVLGSTLSVVAANGPSLLETFPYLPPDLKSPIAPVTNEAGFGYSVNVGTSPPSLAAAQIHGGAGVEVAANGEGLHGWNGSGALTPVKRYAEMLSGTGLNVSGSEWYFPARLTLDTGAVGNGLANPAQTVLGLHSTMGTDLPTSLKILAINSELDKVFGPGGGTLKAAELLAEQSGIPKENLTLINEEEFYAHNDPAGATPSENEFFKHLVPYLEEIGK